MNHDEPRWVLYPLWIIQSFLCIPIALLLNFIILTIITLLVGDFIYVNGVRHITEDYLVTYTFIPLVSLLTGAFQSSLLRRSLPHMGGWLLATAAGWLLGILLVLTPGWLNLRNGSLNLDLAYLMMGFAIGIAQWLLLRQRFGLMALGLFPAGVTAVALALLMKQAKLNAI